MSNIGLFLFRIYSQIHFCFFFRFDDSSDSDTESYSANDSSDDETGEGTVFTVVDDAFGVVGGEGATHDHVLLGEEDIVRCKKNPQIFVRKTKEGAEHGPKRIYNYHCCFVCGAMISNIMKHIRTHKTNSEVKQLRELEVGNLQSLSAEKQQEVKVLHEVLRNRGDHLHNLAVMKQKKGELLVARRKYPFDSSKYGPCFNCLQWGISSNLGRHQANSCVATTEGERVSNGELQTQAKVVMGSINPEASPQLVREVFPIMTCDDISGVAQKDPLIVAFGNFWLNMSIENRMRRKYYTSERMRLVARLLIELRRITSRNLQMQEFLHPQYFDNVISAALNCGIRDVDDEGELLHPSTPIKIGYDVARLCNIQMGFAIRAGDKELIDQINNFALLRKMEWHEKITRSANKILRERRQEKNLSLPLPTDLANLATFLKEKLGKVCLDVTKAANHFRCVAMLTMTRLLLYNKRRSGELEATL